MRVGLIAAIFFMFTSSPLAAQTSWKAQRCRRLATSAEPAGPVAVIDDVVLDGATDVAEPIWKRIVSQMKGETFSGDAWVDELRDVYLLGALQNQGYLKAEVAVDTEPVSSSPALQHVVVHARVRGGPQYRLASVQFVSSEKQIAFSAKELRPLIPLRDEDVFSVAKVREGLEALTRYYGSHGYIDFVAAPKTDFDEMNQQIALVLSLQEGFQWRVGNIEIVGLNPVLESEFRSKIKTGDILHSQLIDDFYQDHKSELPDKVGPEDTQFHFNVKERTADALFDFRSCSQVEN
jgi:outer membrane protein assembly factor BamA